MNELTYWIAILPVNRVTVHDDGGRVWFDPQMLELVRGELGKPTFLISAHLWKEYHGYEFIKEDAQVLGDSGGFQFYGMTPGRLKQFYKVRDKLYRFQLGASDWVIAGDIPAGAELDRSQLNWLRDLTYDNIEFQFSLDAGLGSRFINVLHGISPGNLDSWYSKMKDFPSVGWALGAKASKVAGWLFQFLYLHQQGALKPGVRIHLFGATGKMVVWAVQWLAQELGIDVVLQSDSSSHSLARFGAIFYQGEVTRYADIRGGRVKITLWNGQVLDDLPQVIKGQLFRDMTLTSLQHFARWLYQDVVKGKVEDAVLRESRVRELYKWYRTGGVEMAWARFSEEVKEKSEVRLVDRLEVPC